MAITRQKKGEILDRVRGALSGAQSVAFVNFHGLTIAAMTALRRKLRESGVRFIVAKKTLIRKALGEMSYEGAPPELPGELALAWSDSDQLSPAREIHAAGSKLEGTLAIIGGIFEGRYMNKPAMLSIAAIPSRQTLYTELVHLINSPLKGLVVALDQIATARGDRREALGISNTE